MIKFVVSLLFVVFLAACAPRFGGPVVQVGPQAYRITHTMGMSSPVKGVRAGVIERAVKVCKGQRLVYEKVREEMGSDGGLSYTLTFACVPENEIFNNK